MHVCVVHGIWEYIILGRAIYLEVCTLAVWTQGVYITTMLSQINGEKVLEPCQRKRCFYRCRTDVQSCRMPEMWGICLCEVFGVCCETTPPIYHSIKNRCHRCVTGKVLKVSPTHVTPSTLGQVSQVKIISYSVNLLTFCKSADVFRWLNFSGNLALPQLPTLCCSKFVTKLPPP